MIPWQVDVPQARVAPRSVVAQLRAINPDAVLVHLRQNLWQYGFYRPSEALYHDGAKKYARWHQVPKATMKAKHALIRMAGVVPSEIFTFDELDGRIVNAVARSRWSLHHTSDNELFQQIDTADADKKAAHEAEMRDVGRGRDAFSTAFHSNFGYAVKSVAKPDTVKAGRVRHAIPSTV